MQRGPTTLRLLLNNTAFKHMHALLATSDWWVWGLAALGALRGGCSGYFHRWAVLSLHTVARSKHHNTHSSPPSYSCLLA